MISFIQGATLFATCDNIMKVYIDGVLHYEDKDKKDGMQWLKTKEVKIPSGTQVLGIECLELADTPRGILATTSDGVLTDGSWSCSANQKLKGWAKPGFKDTQGDFSAANQQGHNGCCVWGSHGWGVRYINIVSPRT